jgi:hypothetical protein
MKVLLLEGRGEAALHKTPQFIDNRCIFIERIQWFFQPFQYTIPPQKIVFSEGCYVNQKNA